MEKYPGRCFNCGHFSIIPQINALKKLARFFLAVLLDNRRQQFRLEKQLENILLWCLPLYQPGSETSHFPLTTRSPRGFRSRYQTRKVFHPCYVISAICVCLQQEPTICWTPTKTILSSWNWSHVKVVWDDYETALCFRSVAVSLMFVLEEQRDVSHLNLNSAKPLKTRSQIFHWHEVHLKTCVCGQSRSVGSGSENRCIVSDDAQVRVWLTGWDSGQRLLSPHDSSSVLNLWEQPRRRGPKDTSDHPASFPRFPRFPCFPLFRFFLQFFSGRTPNTKAMKMNLIIVKRVFVSFGYLFLATLEIWSGVKSSPLLPPVKIRPCCHGDCACNQVVS